MKQIQERYLEAELAVEWIREYAFNHQMDYDTLMTSAEEYLKYGHYYCGGAEMEGERTSDEFWEKYQIVRQKEIPEEERGNFFTCSC